MSKTKPACVEARQWVRDRLSKDCFAPFTGQDHQAFAAFAHLLRLYSVADQVGEVGAVLAMSAVASAAQPSVLHVFKAAIPWALDWVDEDRLWARIDPKGELIERRRLELVK